MHPVAHKLSRLMRNGSRHRKQNNSSSLALVATSLNFIHVDSPQQQHGAPPYKGIVFVLLAILVILLTGCVLFLWEVGYFLPAMSEIQARQLIQQAGGADKISREASQLIDTYKTNVSSLSFVYEPEITNFPAILILATNSRTGGLVIEPGYQDLPPHVRIMYGTHRHTRFMIIFDGTNGPGEHFRESYVELSSNIFFSK
jgi:hypothetical protein